MGDFQFNAARGRTAYYADIPDASGAWIAVLIQASGMEADAAMADHDTLAALLAANTEATFTNYSRQTLTTVTPTVDDTNDVVDIDCDDVTFSSAGGASNNTLGKVVFCYDPDTTGGTDADIIPQYAWEYSVTTDGSTLLIQPPTGGFARH